MASARARTYKTELEAPAVQRQAQAAGPLVTIVRGESPETEKLLSIWVSKGDCKFANFSVISRQFVSRR